MKKTSVSTLKEGTQRVNLFLDPDIVKKAKIRAIEEGISLSELLNRIFDSYCRLPKSR